MLGAAQEFGAVQDFRACAGYGGRTAVVAGVLVNVSSDGPHRPPLPRSCSPSSSSNALNAMCTPALPSALPQAQGVDGCTGRHERASGYWANCLPHQCRPGGRYGLWGWGPCTPACTPACTPSLHPIPAPLPSLLPCTPSLAPPPLHPIPAPLSCTPSLQLAWLPQ